MLDVSRSEFRVFHHSLCLFASNLSLQHLRFYLCRRSFESFQSRSLISFATFFRELGQGFLLRSSHSHQLLRFQDLRTSNESCCTCSAVFWHPIGFLTAAGGSPGCLCQSTSLLICSPILFYPDSETERCYGRIVTRPLLCWPLIVNHILANCPFGCSETYLAPSDSVHLRQRLGTW